MNSKLRLGFVGVGTMGAPMVNNLVQAGFSPIVFDTSVQATQRLAQEHGLQVADNLGELGKSADVVILMLPDSAIVKTVCLAEHGLCQSLSEGSVILDMSSSDPIETRQLGARLAESKIILLDAPVSGGLRKAITGELAIMLGGDDEAAIGRVTPLLESMGTVYSAGALAAGHATKALNNFVSAAGLAAACEAVIIGQEFGLDPSRLTEILNASTGRNNSTENKLAQFILAEKYKQAGFALSLMAKDVGLAAALAQHVGKPLPGVSLAAATWGDAKRTLEADADHTEIFKYLADLVD